MLQPIEQVTEREVHIADSFAEQVWRCGLAMQRNIILYSTIRHRLSGSELLQVPVVVNM